MLRAAVLCLAALRLLHADTGALAPGPWPTGVDLEVPDDNMFPVATPLEFHAYDDTSAIASAEALVPQRTIMQCLGTTTVTRACHFENVYYNISGKRFVYFGPAGATSEQFGENRDGEPWLRLIGCASTYTYTYTPTPLPLAGYKRAKARNTPWRS